MLPASVKATTNPVQIPVVVVPQPGQPPLSRNLVDNPFSAEYEDGVVSVISDNGVYGTVWVEITSTAGDSASGYFDTLSGSMPFLVSGLPGWYTITITTGDGTLFYGEFSLLS